MAAGACVQAAAVLTGADPADVAADWGLDDGIEVEPVASLADAADVRAAYAMVRDVSVAFTPP